MQFLPQFLIGLASSAVATLGGYAVTGEIHWWIPVAGGLAPIILLLAWKGAIAEWSRDRGEPANGISKEQLEIEKLRAEARHKFWSGPGRFILFTVVVITSFVLILGSQMIDKALG